MKNRNAIETVAIMGIAVLAFGSSAVAGSVSYTTNSPGTAFVSGGNSLTLNSASGQAATLIFTPNASSTTGVPSNIDLGNFVLACPTCTSSLGATFGSFTFDLIVTDTTDGASGEFVGTSTGGTVSINTSTIQINWVMPSTLQLGPGTLNAISGNFGSTIFGKNTSISSIVAPNSGSTPGNTTIQGQISQTPEPATILLLGGALFGFGVLGRKKALRN